MKKILIALTIITMALVSVACSKPTTESNTEQTQNKITSEHAQDIALEHAKLEATDISNSKVEEDTYEGINVYDIEFYSGYNKYEYTIDMNTGNIINYETEVSDTLPEDSSSKHKIKMEEAKKIALEHANLKSDQVKFTKEQIQVDGKITKYEIDFVNNNSEYSYEIDANTGDVLSMDKD